MNSQDVLTVNIVGAGAFILWYALTRSGGRRPTRLDMKAQDSAPPLINPEPIAVESHGVVSRRQAHPDLVTAKSKSLNVMFNYNGHAWDAYEVLGVPAGASLKSVTDAYQVALRRCDKSSVDFLETAYRAILNKDS